MKIFFVWGQGGVGKTHCLLKLAHDVAKPGSKTLIVTLDPSKRLFYLLDAPVDTERHLFLRWGLNFELKSLNALKLFDDLEAKAPASPWLRHFYAKMVSGLQEFRDYLLLIQLSDELENSPYDQIFIDTPPFQEALGLQRSARQLKTFFSSALVDFALKTNRFSWVQLGVKKLFEVATVFVGKKTAGNLFDFLTWLSQHIDRFQKAANRLEDLFGASETTHFFIATPESPTTYLDEISNSFQPPINRQFILNRSVNDFPEGFVTSDPFFIEMKELKQEERDLEARIRDQFDREPLFRYPYRLMGDDTPEELDAFVLMNDHGDLSQSSFGR